VNNPQYNATPADSVEGVQRNPQADTKGALHVVLTDGAGTPVTAASSDTVGADAESNTSTRGRVVAWLKGFNGTTWDRLRAGVTAIDTTFTGMLNTIPQAVHETTPATRTNGQRGWLQAYTDGSLRVYLGHVISGEDQTNNVMRFEEQGTPTVCTSDTQVKAAAGFLYAVIVQPTDAVPTAGSIIIYNNTAESGTAVLTINVLATAELGTAGPRTIPVNAVMSTGIYAGFTTTTDVSVTLMWR
jgi:hypothetical protein